MRLTTHCTTRLDPNGQALNKKESLSDLLARQARRRRAVAQQGLRLRAEDRHMMCWTQLCYCLGISINRFRELYVIHGRPFQDVIRQLLDAPSRHAWTPGEIEWLMRRREEGALFPQIADELGLTAMQCRSRASYERSRLGRPSMAEEIAAREWSVGATETLLAWRDERSPPLKFQEIATRLGRTKDQCRNRYYYVKRTGRVASRRRGAKS